MIIRFLLSAIAGSWLSFVLMHWYCSISAPDPSENWCGLSFIVFLPPSTIGTFVFLKMISKKIISQNTLVIPKKLEISISVFISIVVILVSIILPKELEKLGFAILLGLISCWTIVLAWFISGFWKKGLWFRLVVFALLSGILFYLLVFTGGFYLIVLLVGK